MYIAWTKHIEDNIEKENFKKHVKSAKPILDRLKDILREEEAGLDRSETDIKTFDQPNWAERQAFRNGYRSCLRIINKIVDLDQQKE